MRVSQPSSSRASSKTSSNPLQCLVSHVGARLQNGTLVVVIHVANSQYLSFIHDLIVLLAGKKWRLNVFDCQRRIKSVYLQQALRRSIHPSKKSLKLLNLRIILYEDHALREYQRLHRITPSAKKPAALFLVDPSGLFGRLIGSVKQAASAVKYQYEVAELFAERGFAVILTDSGGREYHRIETVVPAQLTQAASLLLQFLPRRIIID